MSTDSNLGVPTVLSMRCIAGTPGAAYDWHNHAFFEFSLVSDDSATIGHPPGTRMVGKDTLLLYQPKDNHGGWCGPKESPRFWVVHFTLPSHLLNKFPAFAQKEAEHRVWPLRHEQAETFRWMFLRLLNERITTREHRAEAELAWLNLLLVSVHRWATGDATETITPQAMSPDLVKLWHLVNSCVGKPAEYLREVHSLQNYDSLRHGFKRAFGCSPRDMMLRLRIQHAKNLLLESNLSIKEIADRCGYQRQHEFARAFRQHTGAAPTVWRSLPFPLPSGNDGEISQSARGSSD